MQENFKIDIKDRVYLSDIFNALNHVEFYKRIPPVWIINQFALVSQWKKNSVEYQNSDCCFDSL